MTDSTPDDKNLADEAAAAEETVQDTVDEKTDTGPKTGTAKAPSYKTSTAKKRPAPPADEDEDEDFEEEAPVRRRPRPAARPAAAGQTAGATVTTVVATLVVVALLAAAITFSVLWGMQKSENSDMKAAAADKAQAEKVAAEYAAGASTFDYRDLGPWRTALVKGVSPELKTKLDAAAGAMNQLLQPLQWVSKGTVLDSVVNSQSGSIYKVSAYVNVAATNSQAPSGREMVSVYNVTLDKDKDWLITDSGGAVANPGAAAPADGAQQTPAPTEGAQAPAATPAPGN